MKALNSSLEKGVFESAKRASMSFSESTPIFYHICLSRMVVGYQSVIYMPCAPARRQIFPKTASENGIIFGINMSGELPMQGRRGAMVKYSAAYSTCAERFLLRGW